MSSSEPSSPSLPAHTWNLQAEFLRGSTPGSAPAGQGVETCTMHSRFRAGGGLRTGTVTQKPGSGSGVWQGRCRVATRRLARRRGRRTLIAVVEVWLDELKALQTLDHLSLALEVAHAHGRPVDHSLAGPHVKAPDVALVSTLVWYPRDERASCVHPSLQRDTFTACSRTWLHQRTRLHYWTHCRARPLRVWCSEHQEHQLARRPLWRAL